MNNTTSTVSESAMTELDAIELETIAGGEFMEKVAYGAGFLLGGLAGLGGAIQNAIDYYSGTATWA